MPTGTLVGINATASGGGFAFLRPDSGGPDIWCRVSELAANSRIGDSYRYHVVTKSAADPRPIATGLVLVRRTARTAPAGIRGARGRGSRARRTERRAAEPVATKAPRRVLDSVPTASPAPRAPADATMVDAVEALRKAWGAR
jgi:hypothetical protein